MHKIHELDPEIIRKIAAGQVIERPASIVKELVENALDAGATNISVEVEKGGTKKIRVVDNGHGMEQGDLLRSFLRHTTSKINKSEDLSDIKTFGFRGEALASICAVSVMELKSKSVTDPTGTRVLIKNSQVEKVSAAGMSDGTIIEVTELFDSVPARRKFLKGDGEEYAEVLNVLISFVFANDGVGFELYKDKKLVFKILPYDSLSIRIEKMLGKNIASNMVEVSYADELVSISGYISKPQASLKNTSGQYLYVNKRSVQSKALAKRVKQTYGKLLDAGSYPQTIMFINLEPGLVDVNIHPRKEQVRFWNEPYVNRCVEEAVKQTLVQNNLTYAYGDFSRGDGVGQQSYAGALKTTYGVLKKAADLWKVRDSSSGEVYENSFQLADTYIIYPAHDGLFLVDQHAAHESILYDELVRTMEKDILSSTLDDVVVFEKPITFDLSVAQKNLLKERLSSLEKMGFVISVSSITSCVVSAVPRVFKDHDFAQLIVELVDNIEEFEKGKFIDSGTNKTIAFLACRTAIKAGDVLSKEEQKRLLEKLDECSDLYTCPHGRPVKVKLSLRELEKMFKRVK